MSDQPLDDQDVLLLRRLGALARAADPVPGPVRELGRAAFALRRVDDELAELLADSDVALTAVRASAGEQVRLLTWRAGELVIEAQVLRAGGARTLVGQVVPTASGGVVRLRHAQTGGAVRTLDDLGEFRFDDLHPGPARLSVDTVDHHPVSTEWFTL